MNPQFHYMKHVRGIRVLRQNILQFHKSDQIFLKYIEGNQSLTNNENVTVKIQELFPHSACACAVCCNFLN
jgi:hypothetical protein